jgi:hypothetical protein
MPAAAKRAALSNGELKMLNKLVRAVSAVADRIETARIQSNNQSASAEAGRGDNPQMGDVLSCDPVNFWMEEQRRERPALSGHRSKAFLGCVVQEMKRCRTALL